MTSVPEPAASLLPDRGYLLRDAVDPPTPEEDLTRRDADRSTPR